MGPLTIFTLVERYGISYTDAARRLFGGQGSFGNGGSHADWTGGSLFPRRVGSLQAGPAISRGDACPVKIALVETLMAKDVSLRVAAKRVGQGVTAHESVPFAIYYFLRYPKSFEDCLLGAVLNGADRDTVGAMACTISGAYLGVEAIPEIWRGKIERGQQLQALAFALWERFQQEKL